MKNYQQTHSKEPAHLTDIIADLLYFVGLLFTILMLIAGFPCPKWILGSSALCWLAGSIVKSMSPNKSMAIIWSFLNTVFIIVIWSVQNQ